MDYDKTIKDIFIIGGGINGTAIAADAAGRGLSVILCEKRDLASATSSASSKLIHGGLRYLELYEFNLVRKALRERDILMKKAPHLIQPLEFILPHEKHLRPAWMIQAGLFFYDHLGGRSRLPRSKRLTLPANVLQPKFTTGFSYYDCMTDDARLTLTNALCAQEKGANILTYTECLSAQQENDIWKIELKNHFTQQQFFCYAKFLINAAGPWINHIQKKLVSAKPIDINLVKGSHIVTKKLYSGNYAHLLQNQDGRIVFTIPFQQHFTLIGTTDWEAPENLDHAEIDDGEKKYLCRIINDYFNRSIGEQDIIWSYSGVRCLQGQAARGLSKITREYKFDLDTKNNLLTVVGGKITTHRILAEEAINLLKPVFPQMKPAWTASAPLPGGDMQDIHSFADKFKKQFSWLPDFIADRYIKNYGTRAYLLLENKHSLIDLGNHFGGGLYQHEIDFLIKTEWVNTLEDLLWRRTQLGLFLTLEEQNKINRLFFS